MSDLNGVVGYARRWIELHRENKFQREAAKIMQRVVDALESVRAERDAALAAIGRVRELHQAREDGWCSACAETNDQTGEFQDFPCPTIRALLAALDGAPEPEEKP